MVTVYLTDGFGNNLFQYVAGKLLASHHQLPLKIVPPSSTYYATPYLEELLNIKLSLPQNKEIAYGSNVAYPKDTHSTAVTDANYLDQFSASPTNFKLGGHYENYRFYLPHLKTIRGWFTAVTTKHENTLALHLRTSDRLFMANEFETKPSARDYVCAVEQFNLDNLHIISDTHFWRRTTAEELTLLNEGKHTEKWETSSYNKAGKFIFPGKRVDPVDAANYFNSIVDALAKYNPIFKKRTVLDDFNFLRSSKNILFEHGTLAWWAALLSDAEKVGVYGPWRPWKGAQNHKLSDTPVDNWFKWGDLN
tara:strand:- start:200 stop:1120 length:921 start_codon:yes stop_codon:yes gene_type:complete